MANTATTLTRAAIGAVTAAAMIGAAPAAARDRHDNRYDHRDGIRAGEVIARAIVLGGLAAILSSGHRGGYYDGGHRGGNRYEDSSRYRDDARYGYGYDYRRYGDSRAAINQCVRAAEYRGSRYGRISVTEIRDIDRSRTGYRISGTVVTNDGRYGRGRYDQRADYGRFSCTVRYGQVERLRLSGLG